MVGQLKICPVCKLQASANADRCLQCGHVYNAVKHIVPPPVMPPAPPMPWDLARSRQPQPVLSDPKYLLDTGYGFGCPTCGSRSVQPLPKTSGTGLMYFGSLPTVLAMGAVNSLLTGIMQKFESQPFKCSYCQTAFRF